MRVPPPLTLLALALLSLAAFHRAPASTIARRATVATGQTHRGWTDAIILRNAVVEAVIVPSIGRVMQFRFLGDPAGPFWENEKLAGRPMPVEPWSVAHGSFGGDKTWPAPQSLWNWPPPDTFDAAPVTARLDEDRSVTLTSPVSPRFGIRTVRRISLDATAPVLRIATTYEKITGAPVTVSVWIITQFRDPVAVFLPVPANSKFPDGLAPQWPAPAEAMHRHGDLLRFIRDPKKSYKIGNDADTLVWVGEHYLVRIAATRVPGATYPDDGCIAQLYGNADPVPYVELETVGPLKTLHPGETLAATNTYRLARRTAAGAETDARALLAAPP